MHSDTPFRMCRGGGAANAMACYTWRVLIFVAKGVLPVNIVSRSVFRTGRPGSRRFAAGAAGAGDAEAVVAGVPSAAGLLFPPPPQAPLPCPRFRLVSA
jgi:hypothetical protein